jgi:hypothetical protein
MKPGDHFDVRVEMQGGAPGAVVAVAFAECEALQVGRSLDDALSSLIDYATAMGSKLQAITGKAGQFRVAIGVASSGMDPVVRLDWIDDDGGGMS